MYIPWSTLTGGATSLYLQNKASPLTTIDYCYINSKDIISGSRGQVSCFSFHYFDCSYANNSKDVIICFTRGFLLFPSLFWLVLRWHRLWCIVIIDSLINHQLSLQSSIWLLIKIHNLMFAKSKDNLFQKNCVAVNQSCMYQTDTDRYFRFESLQTYLS